MFKRFTKRSGLWVGIGLGLLVGVGMMVGTLVAVHWQSETQLLLPETALYATGATGGKSMAVATGPIDSDMEGLFTLDFLTGDLQCFVMYTKGVLAYKFGGAFKTNVIKDLGIGKAKAPSFLMVTGQTNFLRGGGADRPALSVVYVIDENTGRFAAYGLLWNTGNAAGGIAQGGQLRLLQVGKVRSIDLRD